jgi:lipopolysaccharide export system protein LptA
MKETKQGRRELDTLEATGNVIIKTGAETVTGSYGIYRAATNKAELTGGVTIKRGENILQGARAEVDLNTNTSRMFGGAGGQQGRVRGVFYPGSEKKP